MQIRIIVCTLYSRLKCNEMHKEFTHYYSYWEVKEYYTIDPEICIFTIHKLLEIKTSVNNRYQENETFAFLQDTVLDMGQIKVNWR